MRARIVLPGLINMHQHHWYTLFKGLADGYLLEDWVTRLLLPLSLKLDRRGDAGVEHASPAWRCWRPAPPARSIIR